MLNHYFPACCKKAFVILLCFFGLTGAKAQYIFQEKSENEMLPEKISLHNYASIADAGDKDFNIRQIIDGASNLVFKPLENENTNIGFTKNHYWVKFSLWNKSNKDVVYYLETARAVTDLVQLYIIHGDGSMTSFKSGDDMPFAERSFGFRKPVFRIIIEPGEKEEYYVHLKSDGEVINMPVLLRSEKNFLQATTLEQLVFGNFYGVLIIVSLIYMFFFFGLKEKSFLYYSLYVIFIGFMQLSLDGYFYQYFMPSGGYFSNRSVIIFACISTFFLGKYAQEFLRIRLYSKWISKAFNTLYIFVAIMFLAVLFIPSFLEYSYRLANFFGLVVLILIVSSVVTLYVKKCPIDGFFTTGVLCLILGFVIFIMNNFSVLPNSFFTENSTKFGTGTEILFLSLAMANFISTIKREREELTRLALVRAEELSELKSYFLSNISHELRTPLNAIMNLIDSISKEVVDEKIRKNCQIIKYSSNNLLSSINDILDFSRIQKNEIKLEIANFEPHKIFDQIKSNAEMIAKDHGIDFEYSFADNIPEVLVGDAMRLTQITNNVISNAVKFTSEGIVKLDVSVQLKPGTKASLTIKVTDTGVGIPKDKIDRIFDSFTQESINNKRKFGGLGLGLFIVKTLVDLQHGTIEMKSEQGRGTICKIVLDFPIATVAHAKITAPEVQPTYDLGGKNILVVEDNAINQIVIKMITKNWGNTALTYVNNGEECLEALKSGTFDIVLMDLQMPIMDGYEATIAIRNGEAGASNAQIPIVAVTADAMEATKLRIREIGMNNYMTKPLNKDILFDTIKELVV
ncbi:7TM diverse intracellular signaling domain-containing protein [Flavobacterium sp. 3HN19-14]|uniref:7TM diverse intracellular signaling domain-containing protein n=1 Tax=Flavobacterium sp. 3HN19-14 TaxID=3448133 RepID=UPI003EE3E042